jgi:hypothetical protein
MTVSSLCCILGKEAARGGLDQDQTVVPLFPFRTSHTSSCPETFFAENLLGYRRMPFVFLAYDCFYATD